MALRCVETSTFVTLSCGTGTNWSRSTCWYVVFQLAGVQFLSVVRGLFGMVYVAAVHGWLVGAVVCVTRRKHHRPGIAPNTNTTHVSTAGSSAAPGWYGIRSGSSWLVGWCCCVCHSLCYTEKSPYIVCVVRGDARPVLLSP